MKFILAVACLIAVAAGAELHRATETRPAYYKDIVKPPTLENSIINGSPATRNQFPYQVSLTWGVISRYHICGGTIISESVVLTAGHCIETFGSYVIVAGILNRGETVESAQSRETTSITNHPNWPGGSDVGPWDIAIMKLASPLVLSTAVQPASLPTAGATFTGTAFLSGWGAINAAGTNAPIALQFAEKTLITNTECAAALIELLETAGPLDASMICTSGAQRVSVCPGDSGGPLVQNGVLIGVVSWGISPCGTINAPSVFTRTSSYIDWLNTVGIA